MVSRSATGNMKSHSISEEVVVMAAAATGADDDDESSSSVEKASSGARARDDLRHFEQNHQHDPNLPPEKLTAVRDALARGDAKEMAETDALLGDDSPYEEVRVAVRNTDGGEVANTVRAWILGMLFVTLGAGLNMFLSMRYVEAPMSSPKRADKMPILI